MADESKTTFDVLVPDGFRVATIILNGNIGIHQSIHKTPGAPYEIWTYLLHADAKSPVAEILIQMAPEYEDD